MPDLDIFERQLTGRGAEPGKIPVIERLASFLVDTTALPRDVSSSEMLVAIHSDLSHLLQTCDFDLIAILNFFALIGQANAEGRNALLKSVTLIPSLVYFLANFSSLIWEEDVQVIQDADLAKRWFVSSGVSLLSAHYPSQDCNAHKARPIPFAPPCIPQRIGL